MKNILSIRSPQLVKLISNNYRLIIVGILLVLFIGCTSKWTKISQQVNKITYNEVFIELGYPNDVCRTGENSFTATWEEFSSYIKMTPLTKNAKERTGRSYNKVVLEFKNNVLISSDVTYPRYWDDDDSRYGKRCEDDINLPVAYSHLIDRGRTAFYKGNYEKATFYFLEHFNYNESRFPSASNIREDGYPELVAGLLLLGRNSEAKIYSDKMVEYNKYWHDDTVTNISILDFNNPKISTGILVQEYLILKMVELRPLLNDTKLWDEAFNQIKNTQ